MNIEIIAIGNEILSGLTINTNAAFIGKKLLEEGFRVTRHTTLPDNNEAIEKGLREALARSDIIITTGGLGPTCDDLTCQIAAKVMNSDMRFDEEIAADLAKRYTTMNIAIKQQATVPSKALILRNSVGTAPGSIFKHEKGVLALLPGVPIEMQTMLTDQVIPYLIKFYAGHPRYFNRRMHLAGLPELAIDPLLRQLQIEYPKIGCGIYPGLGIVSIELNAFASSKEEASQLMSEPMQKLEKQFADFIFESSSGKLEEAIHNELIKRKTTLSIAESCTGGFLTSVLTMMSGASQYVLGSVVAYANQSKTKLLKVPESLILEKGAVSEEVASKMLEGLFPLFESEYGMAITGIAGPSGGSEEKPVGTICCAVGGRNKQAKIWKHRVYGNREMIIYKSVNHILTGFLSYLKESI